MINNEPTNISLFISNSIEFFIENLIELFTQTLPNIPMDIWLKWIFMILPLLLCNQIFYKKLTDKPMKFKYEMLEVHTLFIVVATVIFFMATTIIASCNLNNINKTCYLNQITTIVENKEFICGKFVLYCYFVWTILVQSIMMVTTKQKLNKGK